MNTQRLLGLFVRLVIIAAISAIVAYPIVSLAIASFYTGSPVAAGTFALSNYVALFNSGALLTLAENILFALPVIIIAVVPGTIAAVIVRLTDFRYKSLIETVLLLPLFMTGISAAVAWDVFATPRVGIMSKALGFTIFDPSSLFGIQMVMGLFFSPLAYWFVSSSLSNLNTELIEASQISGIRLRRTFTGIVIPLILPSLASISLIIFMLTMGDFTIPVILGYSKNYPLLVVKIFLDLTGLPPQYQIATAASMLVLGVSLAAFYVQSRLLANRSFVTLTGKSFRQVFVDLKSWKPIAIIYCIVYTAAVAIFPVTMLFLLAFTRFLGVDNTFTLAHFMSSLSETVFRVATVNSVIATMVGATLGVALSIAVTLMVSSKGSVGGRVVEGIVSTSLAVPALVLGLGMLWAWLIIYHGIYNTLEVIIIALLAFAMPYGVRQISSGLRQIGNDLIDSASISGASYLLTLRKVILPLLQPFAVTSWVFLFTVMLKEIGTIIFITTATNNTLAVFAFSQLYEGLYSAYAVIGVVQLVLGIIPVALIVRAYGRNVFGSSAAPHA